MSTLALEDGADQHVIETRVTHTKKRRSAFDGYNRGLQWERTGAEISKLKIWRRPAGRRDAIALPIAVGAEGPETAETAERGVSLQWPLQRVQRRRIA